MKHIIIASLLFLTACHPPDPQMEMVKETEMRLEMLEQRIQQVKYERYVLTLNHRALKEALKEYREWEQENE